MICRCHVCTLENRGLVRKKRIIALAKKKVVFSTQTTEMHILAVIMLHQHKFCVYNGKRKLKLLITCENFVLLCTLTVFILLCKYVLRKCGKLVYIRGLLERVGWVTVNTTFFALLFLKFWLSNVPEMLYTDVSSR